MSPENLVQLPDRPATLLTGATGALGQEVLFQLLTAQPQKQLMVLVRGSKKGGGADKRVRALLRRHFAGAELDAALSRLTVLDGDLNEPQMGLAPQTYRAVAERLSGIMHCAAAVRFDQPLEEAREINVTGTQRALELAQTARQMGNLPRFDYVGTAYIAGKRRGVAYETELEHRKGFHNTYEQTKYEAELLVRRHAGELPVTIYRPSIIIGNSRTGETPNFKAFYWPIRVYAMGQMRLLPGVADCRIDLVPVDYVASALVELSSRADSIGGCYHLTAGRDNLITLREIMDAAIGFFKNKPPTLIHPMLLKPAEGWLGKLFLKDRMRRTLKLGEPYYPYLMLKLEFDNAVANQALASAGIIPPAPHAFFDRLFRYCVETDWGRKSGVASEIQEEKTAELALG
jgi:thioester reductase-like protein